MHVVQEMIGVGGQMVRMRSATVLSLAADTLALTVDATVHGHLSERSTPRLRGGAQSMKIALCAWESLHSIAVGGVAPHVTELAAGLVRRGHEVHLFTRANEVGGKLRCLLLHRILFFKFFLI